ncbi:uncharacterized protein LOC114960127 [Acropora millepora]|uniref:uncharacterized protein LOC114960127 n=1 Tax=Acropora millepora TaxID=45264 RepID=UPI001CF435A8|nr:uncharacterized protein LOC114960127 [Acropora millepora]XP_029194224.2 uncharacterized protein LOC114960127 [Acropora millepora]
MDFIFAVWIVSNGLCFVLTATADLASKNTKRDDILPGLHLGPGEDLFGSTNFESNLLKNEEKHEDASQRAAFPIMDAFKEHTLLTADDLREKVENGYSDQIGIREAVENALKKLHKRKEKAAAAVSSPPSKPHVVTAKELVDEVVKQEIDSHLGTNNAEGLEGNTAAINSDELRSKLHQKLEEITKIETKLFTLIRDVKGFLLKKKSDAGDGKDDSTVNDDSDLENISVESLVSKRSEIPFNIERFRRNETLVANFIRDALKEDLTINPNEYDENDNTSGEDKDAAKQGDTRDLLVKGETQKALLKEAVPGDLEDIPMSSLEREIDENDSVASDHGITRDALVDSPFSSLDYKKITGKRSRHFLS